MARANKYTSLNFNDIFEKKVTNSNNSSNSSTSTPSKSSSSSLSSPHKSYSLSASSRIHGNMLVLSRPSPEPQPRPQPQPQPQPQPLKQQHSLPQSQPQSHIQQHPQSQTQQIQQHLQSQIQQIKQHPPSNSITPQTQSRNQPSILSAPASKSPESISLRPKGNTGGSSSFQERDSKADVISNIYNNSINNNNHNNSSSSSNNNNNNNNKFVPPHLRPGFVPKEVTAVPEFQKPKQGNHRPISAHGNFQGSPNRFVDDGRPKTGGGYDRRMRGPGPGPGPVPGPAFGTAESNSVRPRSGGSRPSSSGW